MQKYIAVIKPNTDKDEIESLIGKGIAGALFQISHENYPAAADMIGKVKQLSKKYNKPISIIQDVSGMTEPLDLEFGLKSGSHWIITDQPEHVKVAKGLDKLSKIIFKGRNLPQGIRVDSVLADSFLDPDAQILGRGQGQIKHLISDHEDQRLIDAAIEIVGQTGHTAIVVEDLDLAKALSWRRHNKKIIFAPKDAEQANRASIYWGVHPIFRKGELSASVRASGLVKKGERLVDASNVRHIQIKTA